MDTEQLKRAAANMALGLLENDSDHSTVGVNNVWPNPPHRKALAGTLDAPWGEKPGPVGEHSTAVVEAANEGRGAMIERLFDGVPQARAAQKGIVSALFAEEGSAEHHSVLLKSKVAHILEDPSLSERVLRVAGRR